MNQDSAPAPERPALATGPKYYLAVVGMIYAAAVGLRVARFLSARLSAENGLVGSTAEQFLRGDFPLFLMGKDFMGVYDVLPMVPLLHFLGPSSYILNLWSPLYTLGAMIVVHRLLQRVVGPWGVLTGLAFLAIPPAFWLHYCGYAQTHYTLGVLLSALLMLQTARLSEAEHWGAGQTFLWGLAAGAGLYGNAQTVGVFLACAAFLLATSWRRVRPLNLVAFCGGGLLGGLPLLYYLLTAQTAYADKINVFSWGYVAKHFHELWTNALPIILGFNTPPTGGSLSPASPWFGLYLLLLAVVCAGLGGLIKRGLRGRPRLALLFPLVAAVYVVILLTSHYGLFLHGSQQAYLMSLYLVLPAALGLVVTWFEPRAKIAAGLLTALTIGINVGGYAAFRPNVYPLFLSPAIQARQNRDYLEAAELLRRAGAHHVYAEDSWLLGFYGNGDPLAVHPWQPRKNEDAHRVDASLDPLFYGVDIASSTTLLGLKHKIATVGGRLSRWGFAQPDKGLLLERHAWRARSLNGQDLGDALGDGDLASGFQTAGPAGPGQGFVLDLGAAQTVSGLALIPQGYVETPKGLTIEGSLDGHVFFPLAQSHGYVGPFYMSGPHPVLKLRHPRVESYWRPCLVRQIRISHLGRSNRPWSAREVLLWGPGPAAGPDADWSSSAVALRRLVGRLKPARVYADTWAAAVARTSADAPPWISLAHGFHNESRPDPPLAQWPELIAGRGSLVVVDRPEAAATRRALELLGLPFTEASAGRLRAFALGNPPARPVIEPRAISSRLSPAAAAQLAHPGGRTPWSTNGPQSAGGALDIDLGRPRLVRLVELRAPDFAQDYPRALTAWVSDDGRAWRPTPLAPAGPLFFSGQMLLRRGGAVNIFSLGPGVTTRHLRLALAPNHCPWWWSVQELVLR
ncbi:hypothetical protein [Desulfarculus baarsii]